MADSEQDTLTDGALSLATATTDEPAAGWRIGRYAVTGKLGSGGMGDVLSVRDEAIGREVAAKVIRGRPDRHALRKFIQEAQITGQLEHPSIVPAYELGKTKDGLPYLTMKRIDGEDLASLIQRTRDQRATSGIRTRRRRASTRRRAAGSGVHARPRTPAPERGLPDGLHTLLQVFLKVCEGVAYAHSKQVIHRDLKPANIMVGAFGEVLVMDWGLAKVLGRERRTPTPTPSPRARPASEDAAVLPDLTGERGGPLRTMDGTIMGTPTYMPPEQAEGQVERIDQRADVYALGAILYEMLALAPPFEGTSAWSVLAQVSEGPSQTPAERVDGRWPVPWELEAVVERAMARRRGDRYPSVEQLAADVEAFLAGRTVSTARYTGWQRVRRFARQHWRSVAAAAVALISLIAALGYGYLSASREASAVAASLQQVEAARQQAVANAERARAKEREAEASAERARTSAQQAEANAAEAQANLAMARRMAAVELLDAMRREVDLVLHWTPLERDEQGLTGELIGRPMRQQVGKILPLFDRWRTRLRAFQQTRPEFEQALRELDPSSKDPWILLCHRIHTQCLEEIDALSELDRAVQARRDRLIERRDQQPDAAAWAAVSRRLAASPRYANGPRAIEPQVDLIPLGPDPTSGLEEFAHVGSGEPPRRGADGQLVFGEDTAIVFVLIPGGLHKLGTTLRMDPLAYPHEGPLRMSEVAPYFIGKTELTQAQWVALGGTNPSRVRAGSQLGDVRITGRFPVEQVTWTECVALLGAQGLVLPTEIQWEIAARGGTETPWWTGRDAASLRDADNMADARAASLIRGMQSEAWTDDHLVTAPVASITRRRHPFGLFDVHGNVEEWCRDLYDPEANQQRPYDFQGRRRPSAALKAIPQSARKRSKRGGSWYGKAHAARVTLRKAERPDDRRNTLGCRPARHLVVSKKP